MNKRLLTTIISILVLVLFVFFLAIIYYQDNSIKINDAKIVNVTDTSVTLVYRTEDAVKAEVHVFNKDSKYIPLIGEIDSESYYDERDIEYKDFDKFDVDQKDRYTHFVLIKKLTPDTEYKLRVKGLLFSKEIEFGSEVQAKTKKLNEKLVLPDPGYGKVLSTEENDSLIILRDKDDGSLVSGSVIEENSTYSIDMNLLKKDSAEDIDVRNLIVEIYSGFYRTQEYVYSINGHKPFDTIFYSVPSETVFEDNSSLILENNLVSSVDAQDGSCSSPDLPGVTTLSQCVDSCTSLGQSSDSCGEWCASVCTGLTIGESAKYVEGEGIPVGRSSTIVSSTGYEGGLCNSDGSCNSGQGSCQCNCDGIAGSDHCGGDTIICNNVCSGTGSVSKVGQSGKAGNCCDSQSYASQHECSTDEGRKSGYMAWTKNQCPEAIAEDVLLQQLADMYSYAGTYSTWQEYVCQDPQRYATGSSLAIGDSNCVTCGGYGTSTQSCAGGAPLSSMASAHTVAAQSAYCVIALGTNDILTESSPFKRSGGVTKFKEDYKQSISDLRANGCQPIILEPPKDTHGRDVDGSRARAIREVSQETGTPMVSTSSIDPSRFADGLHIDQAQCNEIAAAVQEQINEIVTYVQNGNCGGSAPVQEYEIPYPGEPVAFSVPELEESIFGPVSAQSGQVKTEIEVKENGIYSIKDPGGKVITKKRFVIQGGKAVVKLFYDENQNGVKEGSEEYVKDLSTFSIEKEAVSLEYSLNTGWNLIHIPLVQSEDAIDKFETASDLLNLFNSQGANIYHVAKYEDAKFVTFTQREGEQVFADNFYLEPGKAVFVFNNAPQLKVSIGGNKIDESVPIGFSNGWNLVGIISDKNYTSEALLNELQSQGINASTISNYDSGLYSSVVLEDELFYGQHFPINDQFGYFINVTDAGDKEFNP